jgi:histidinol-phosphate aminotransferase
VSARCFNRNEPAIAPEHVLSALSQIGADALRTYPEQAQLALGAALSKRLRVREENVVLGNGADELLLAVCRAVLEPGDGAAIVAPAFEMYERAIALAHGRAIRVPYPRRWQIVPSEFAEASRGAKLAILGNPNNPTGDALGRGALADLRERLPGAVIVVDEVYRSFSTGSLADAALGLRGVVVVGSLSKVAGLAGMRVGYAIAAQAQAERIRSCIAPYPLSAASIAVALAYLENEAATRAYERALTAQTQRSLAAIERALVPIARDLWRSDANFLLADFGDRADALVGRLAARGIAVRTFADPQLAGMVRFCAGSDADTSALLEALADA